jgi:YD repeat-containing protein
MKMNRLPRSNVWILFLISVFILSGIGLYNPGSSVGFDAPPKDQGHTGPRNDGPKPPKPPVAPKPPKDGDPVIITDGNFAYDHQDILIPGKGFGLYVKRYYNSNDLLQGPFGHGWSFMPYINVLEVVKGSEQHAIVRWGNGLRMQYLRNADGTYTGPKGWYYVLSKTASGFTLTHIDQTIFSFDATGKLAAVVNRAGNRLSLSYDGTGRIARIEDTNNRALIFNYDSQRTVQSITDFTGRTVNYAYDDNNNLTGVTDADGGTINYGYDADDNLTTMTDERGKTYLAQTYDTNGRVNKQTYADGTMIFSYNPSLESGGGWSPAFTRLNLNGHLADYYYNADGKVTRIYDRQINKNIYMSYDGNLNLIEFTDPGNNKTVYGYDARGNLISVKNFLNQTTLIEYHPVFNQVTKITYPSGTKVDFEYDAGGALDKVTLPDGTQATYGYSATGVSLTDPDGTTSFTLDQNNYVTAIVDKDGSTTSYTYDAVGNVKTVTDTGGTSSFDYDARDRLLKATDPANQTTNYAYDAHGNLTGVTYPDGTAYSFAYDDYNRLVDPGQSVANMVSPDYNPTVKVRQKIAQTLGKYMPYRFLAGIVP